MLANTVVPEKPEVVVVIRNSAIQNERNRDSGERMARQGESARRSTRFRECLVTQSSAAKYTSKGTWNQTKNLSMAFPILLAISMKNFSLPPGEKKCNFVCIMPPWIKQSLGVAAKDAASELKTRYALNALGMFVVVTIAIMLFATAGETLSTGTLAGVLWIVIFFSAMAGLGRSFVSVNSSDDDMLMNLNKAKNHLSAEMIDDDENDLFLNH